MRMYVCVCVCVFIYIKFGYTSQETDMDYASTICNLRFHIKNNPLNEFIINL